MNNIDVDTCLQLVSDQQRRCVLQHLRNRPAERIAVEALTEAVAHTEYSDEAKAEREREQIAIQLSHTHLPRFADHGVIDYDREGGTVRYQPNERVESLLDSLPQEALAVSPDAATGSPTR